ncbi:hypothetical protein D3C78_1782370 [compost metagenome]
MVWAKRSLAVGARREYSSAARLSLADTGNNSVPLRSGAESSLTPSSPRTSSPKPSGPWVNPDSMFMMKPWAHSSAAVLAPSSLYWRSR